MLLVFLLLTPEFLLSGVSKNNQMLILQKLPCSRHVQHLCVWNVHKDNMVICVHYKLQGRKNKKRGQMYIVLTGLKRKENKQQHSTPVIVHVVGVFFSFRVIRAPVPWHPTYKDMKGFNEEHLFITNPLMLRLQEIWFQE